MSHRTERRHRKKLRERNETPPSPCGVSLDESERSQRDFELFRDPAETATDLRLVRRAVNNDWDVAQQSRDWIIERVMGIVRQERGALESESDRNSILACATMLRSRSGCRIFRRSWVPDLAKIRHRHCCDLAPVSFTVVHREKYGVSVGLRFSLLKNIKYDVRVSE